MTKYMQNFLAIILVIEIVSTKNSTFAFLNVAFLCFVERTPFEVPSCFVIKYFYIFYIDPDVCSGVTSRNPVRGVAKARASLGP